jgi:hypothetical protein
MSNDIIIQLKNSLAAIQPGIDDDTRAVAGNGSAAKRISIDGGVFRKMVGGKEVAAVDDRFMHVILVKMAHNPSRTYYEGAYRKGVKSSPTCWSQDAKTPALEVKNAPAKSCETCPMSVKGSGAGGTGTACRLSWRTAVVLPNDPSGDVMQLVLPATSVFGSEEGGKWPFRAYIQMLANNNISAGRVVTKMQFDTKASVPRLLFSPVAAVLEDMVDVIAQQGTSDAAERAIKLTVFQTDSIGEAPAQPEEVVEDAATPAPVWDEPKLRESTKTEAPPVASEAADIINKWKKPK